MLRHRSTPRLRRRIVAVVAIGVAVSLLAPACSGSPTRSASGTAVDPVTLPALAGRSGSGPVAPVFGGSVIGPDTWVSTSLAPTLEVPDETGAWTFTVADLGGEQGGFRPVVVRSSSTTARLSLSDGLQQGNVYTWKAEGPEGRRVGGTFQVDVEMRDSQTTDNPGGIDVGLSSGEAAFSWSSHTMASVAGDVGFTLQYEGSNVVESGVPRGWDLQIASSSQWTKVIARPGGTVAVVATNGSVSNYRASADGFVPVELSSTTPELLGLAPVLVRNATGKWSVIAKDSTSVFVDDDGDGTAELSGVYAQGRAVLSQTSERGRVTSVTDPVSKRSIQFVYGGGACPKVAAGFVAAPADHLCAVRFWDGSTSAIGYVTAPDGSTTIGRLVDRPEAGSAGARVTDLAWDGSGRPGAVRSPLVASAIAANIVPDGDDRFVDVITYDSTGRVASVAQTSASPSATRCTRVYRYPSTTATSIDDSCWGGQVRRVDFDPSTFFPLTDTDQAGLTTTFEWDLRSGELLRTVGTTGLVTTNTYRDGHVVEARGPSREPATAKVSRTGYDQQFTISPDGTDMKGLDVTYWPSADDAASAGLRQLGPQVDGRLVPSLLVNWSTSPLGTAAPWSAIMTGTLEVTTEGKYTFAAASSGTSIRVNNILCVDTACRDMELKAGRQQLRVDLTVPAATGSMDVTWSGPDTGGSTASIPTDRLRPQYGYTTTSRTIDPTATSAPRETITRTDYAAPEKAQVGATVNQAGLSTSLAYERGTGGDGGWGRQNATTSAGGSSYAFSYWGDTEAAQSPCPGAKRVNQGGGSKVATSPSASGAADGRTTTTWYDAAGRKVATAVEGGATTCTTYDNAGRVSAVEVLGMGSVQRTRTTYAVGGDPLVTEITSTQGPTTSTSRSEVDLLGRTVSTTDRYGIVVATRYDPRTGSASNITSTAPGAAPSVETRSYDAAGRMTGVDVDGRRMATLAYGPTGLLLGATYGDGIVAALGYDAADQVVSIEWSGPTKASVRRVVSAAGNTSSMTFTADGRSSTFAYAFDSAMRLEAAAVDAGLVPTARSWKYAYDANSNRVRQTVGENGATTGDWTYAYDGSSRLVRTDDPAVAGGLAYDDRGNATQIGADTFVYDAAEHLTSATDGKVTVTYERDVAGNVRTKTTSGRGADATIRYGSAGYLLDEANRVVGRQVRLPGGVTVDLAPATPQWRFTGIDGNLFFVTDDAGARVGDAQVFEPFGRVLTAPVAQSPELPSTTWQMANDLESESLGVAYVMMGARVYVPALGRFAQVDPAIGGSANPYDYVNQNPVDNVDPSGESTTTVVCQAVAYLASMIISIFIQNWVGAFMMAQGFSVVVAGAVTGAVTGLVGDAVYQGVQMGLLYATGNGDQAKWSLGETGFMVAAGAIAGTISAAVQLRNARRAAQDVVPNPQAPANPPVAAGAGAGQPPVAQGQGAVVNAGAAGGGAAGGGAVGGIAGGGAAGGGGVAVAGGQAQRIGSGPIQQVRPLSGQSLDEFADFLSFSDRNSTRSFYSAVG